MATTAEYLTQLQTDKSTLVTNLVAKGIDATNDETFTTLVPKVASIQGGNKYAPRYISFYNYKGTELDEELANLDTSNIISMYGMFYSCQKLTTLDLTSFDTSKVTNMSFMFNYCTSLVNLNLTNFNTSNVSSMSNMFSECGKLVNIPKLNAVNADDIYAILVYCKSLTDFGGLENLGQAYSTTKSANYNYYRLDLSTCKALTEQSLINVLTNLYDIATKGCKAQQVVLGATNLAKLTSTEGQQALAQAQQFGWNIS